MSSRNKKSLSRKAQEHAADLLAFEAFVDELLEQAIRRRLGITATLEEILPALPSSPATFIYRRRLWLAQPLHVAGTRVGTAALSFPTSADAKTQAQYLHIFCEELDAILWNIQTAAFKQRLIERVTRALTRPVFHEALYNAVAALREAVHFETLVILYVHESIHTHKSIRYRVFTSSPRSRTIRCTHSSDDRPLPILERIIRTEGEKLLSSDSHAIARVLKLPNAVETLFIAGIRQAEYLGQLTLSTPQSLDTFGRDLMRVFTNTVSQRLIDYRRERRHLGQYFSGPTINALLQHSNYRKKYLAPRLASIAVLYADINSFTRICETLHTPGKIGSFIDTWSNEAVRILWKHGGVFDKMVGDCVIAHFGPPFFQLKPRECALAAIHAAKELQTFTRAFGQSPENTRLARRTKIPGLGLGIGINICRAAIGFFGPNQDYTAFSSGMNQTARLQSLSGFRETLVMDSARKALGDVGKFRFGNPLSTRVKNVAKPLKYFKLL